MSKRLENKVAVITGGKKWYNSFNKNTEYKYFGRLIYDYK